MSKSYDTKEAIFITEWKDKMKDIINARFGHLSKTKVDKYLNQLIEKNIYNPRVAIVNNYTNQKVETTVLDLIDAIRKNNLIIGGGGVLYAQHGVKDNILLEFIVDLRRLRDGFKRERKKYQEDTDEYLMADINQNNVKVKVNSLYGVHGYPLFYLYNRFIAESITNCGRQIISTAVMTFENFLSGSVKFNTESEVYLYIDRIANEVKNDKMHTDLFDTTDIENKIMKILINRCAFDPSDEFIIHINSIVNRLTTEQKILLYYKNNLFEFSRIPFIRDKIRYIIETLDELNAPEMYLIKDQSVVDAVESLWEFYSVFVLYDYPVFDRVRKTMYTDRKNVLYIDTDSNFLALNHWVRFCKDEVLQNNYNKDEKTIDFIAVNLIGIILSRVIDKGLHTFAYNMNVSKEYADMLTMKNEFYLNKIVFTDSKKRYISNAILQEGKLLGNGLGKPEIKGFDFKKASVKPFVRDYYTQICLDDILRVDNIDVEVIFRKILALRKDIEESMKRGESKYFKQMTVQIVEHYKKPYSNQGICAVILWNTLCKDYTLELPTDVDIVPIKPLGNTKSNKKNIEWFKTNYPDAYQMLEDEIYNNPNPLIANMPLKYIAKPKNTNIELPKWFADLVDTEKVVLDITKLFHPVLKSLGLKILKTDASTEYMTNIVDL